MAKLDDLIDQISDGALRAELTSAARDLRKREKFGLVFEEHIPEVTLLRGFPMRGGMTVYRKDDAGLTDPLEVESLNGTKAKVRPASGGRASNRAVRDLVVLKRFGEPIYPALRSLGAIEQKKGRPHHAVIDGENYHALQLMAFLYEGQVDCMYLDPPYNTGARDWKYNNRYVDLKDGYRHSKWLSMMEKRLRLAKRLLRDDGVLVITIDENEAYHLGVLLEDVFPKHQRYQVSIVINPKGVHKANFARVEEYAIFCVPQGKELIAGEAVALTGDEQTDDQWEWGLVRRRGSESRRKDRPSMFYPIFIDEKKKKVVRVGQPIPLGDDPDFTPVKGLRPVWPIDGKGEHRRWQLGAESMAAQLEAGNLALGRYNKKLDSWTINIRRPKKTRKRLKTVWWEKRHDAGTHGTNVVDALLGEAGRFPFPKSIYAVRDCLAAVCRDRPEALIVDAFAGSGTTLHATALLNAEDGGTRRCVLVTNNEVDEKLAKRLNAEGAFPGDKKYDQHGIFEAVCRPRCEAALTGKRPDGSEVPGKYIDGRPYAKGFEENCEFFRIEYLDPDEVELGQQFAAILPTLWLAAGGVGPRPKVQKPGGFVLPDKSPFGVLLRETSFRKFADALAKRADVTHVWIVTDSERAFADMRSALPGEYRVGMLYRDYLRTFAINTPRSA